MKKRIVSLLSLAVVLGVGLTSCGGNGFANEKNISTVAREDGSGTKSAFMEIIGLKGKADPSGVVIATGTAGVLAEVKSNPQAIAYDSLGYVTSDVKKLKVNNVEATIPNIKDGSYKIARPLNVIYKAASLEKEVNNAYYTFLQSSVAQTIISDNGYVALIDGASDYKVNASLSGAIAISGSTSLQPLMILLADKFEELQPSVKVTVSGGGSGTGYQNGENGVSDFGMISEEFNSTKAPSCTFYTVAKDGIAIIVNSANSHENITIDELKNIYNADQAAESKITTWSQVA